MEKIAEYAYKGFAGYADVSKAERRLKFLCQPRVASVQSSQLFTFNARARRITDEIVDRFSIGDMLNYLKDWIATTCPICCPNLHLGNEPLDPKTAWDAAAFVKDVCTHAVPD